MNDWELSKSISSIFNKEVYPKSALAKNNWLTYMIALKQSPNSIEKALQTAFDKNQEKVSNLMSGQCTDYKLTPWHVAVLSGEKYVDLLLKFQKMLKVPSITVQDVQGWTPQHYAMAAKADNLFKKIQDSGVLKNVPARSGVKAEDLPFVLGYQSLIKNRNVAFVKIQSVTDFVAQTFEK